MNLFTRLSKPRSPRRIPRRDAPKKSVAMGILEKIKDIELEMSRTQKNKVRLFVPIFALSLLTLSLSGDRGPLGRAQEQTR